MFFVIAYKYGAGATMNRPIHKAQLFDMLEDQAMAMTDWSMKGTEFPACNSDFRCPGQFMALPTPAIANDFIRVGDAAGYS